MTKTTLRAKLIRPVENRHLRWLRGKMQWSIKGFGEAFKISKDYGKKLLRKRNPFAISKPIAARYRTLRTQVESGAVIVPSKEITISLVANWTIEDGAEVVAMLRPRRCRGHRLLFIPNVPRRVYCTRGTIGECQKMYRAKLRKRKRKEKKNVPRRKPNPNVHRQCNADRVRLNNHRRNNRNVHRKH